MDTLKSALAARLAALDPLSLRVPLPTFGFLVAAYCIFAPRWPDKRSRAYVLSTISSGCMTLASLPFLYLYLTGGLPAVWAAGQSGWTHTLSTVIVSAFGTYLFADLFVGVLAYPKEIGLLTGWVHHVVYIGVMMHLATTNESCIFMAGAIMELPTFDLAISHLWPARRCDERFLSLMVLTRGLYNLVLVLDTARPSSRALMEGSWVPTVILSLALTLHTSWMYGGINGYLRRARKAKAAAKEEALKNEKAPLSAKLSPLELVAAEDGGPTPDESPLVTPYTPSQPSILIPQNLFPNITMPTMANLPIPNIPTLSGMANALPQAKANLEQLQFGFKEVVRERLERWEEQRDRLREQRDRLRRRAGWIDEPEDQLVDIAAE